MGNTPKQTVWCRSVKDSYECELDADHDGPHRVRYQDYEDETWTDSEEDYKAEL
jgi:hypothetical protein